MADDQQQRDRWQELREPDETEIERAARQRVHLPADGHCLHLVGEPSGQARDPEADERSMREERVGVGGKQGGEVMTGSATAPSSLRSIIALGQRT